LGKREGSRPLGKLRRRWEDNIKIDLKAIGYESVDWINLSRDGDIWRVVVNTITNGRVPLDAGFPLVLEELLASEGLCSMGFGRCQLLANVLVL
jgi:hypothetical protein